MRKVFSSQRLENVERVAELLRAEGIEVKIENGRSFRGHRRGNFSYDTRKQPENLPSVWILRSEDQPRGRQLLRDMGLLESTRNPGPSYVVSPRHNESKGLFSTKRIKLGLLVLIAAGIGLIAFGTQLPDLLKKPAQTTAAAPAPAKPPLLIPETITDLQTYRADVPTALAALLIEHALQQPVATACIRVDDKDPTSAMLTASANNTTTLYPASTCPQTAQRHIAIGHYLTDGSGSGSVILTVDRKETTLHVAREGRRWTTTSER